MKILGIDEAGRGPVLGPMVMCGVVIDESRVRDLVNIGVKDSKQLLPAKRRALYEQLQNLVDSFHVVIVEPKEIDAAVFASGFNLNKLEAQKSADIIRHLKPERAILDCPSPNLMGYKSEVEFHLGDTADRAVEIIPRHKADVDFPVVSAASIIAKVTRDAIIEELKEKYGEDFGSGYLSDPKTSIFLEEHWNTPAFATLFRKSWEPWKRISYSQGQMHLANFNK